jgi:4a-hydroxytetrahydrobiopterin dehydratase
MSAVVLSPEALANARHELPQWHTLPDGHLSRTVQFESFVALIAFVNALADEAERAQHHPRLLIEYSRLTIDWKTHDVGGLTQRDIELARWCDDMLENGSHGVQ